MQIRAEHHWFHPIGVSCLRRYGSGAGKADANAAIGRTSARLRFGAGNCANEVGKGEQTLMQQAG